LFVNQQSSAAAGTVVSLWRYPVKSMMGEELNSSYVMERGLVGDRAYAVIDKQTAKVASAKNPRKWGKLFDFRSMFVVDSLYDANNIPPVRITFPDGSNISSDHEEDDMDSSLSKVFDREVRLMKANGFVKPSYEEYWPHIDGLAQRETVTDEAMPSKTLVRIYILIFHFPFLLTNLSINTYSQCVVNADN
jgi:uncharacterized protein